MKITSAVISGAILKRNRPNLPAELDGMINIRFPSGWSFPDSDQAYQVGTVFDYDLEEIYTITNHDILWIQGWTSNQYHTAIVDGITDRVKNEYKKIQGIVLFDKGMTDYIPAALAKHPVNTDKPQVGEDRGKKAERPDEGRGIIAIDRDKKTSTFKIGLPWLALVIAAAAVWVASGD